MEELKAKNEESKRNEEELSAQVSQLTAELNLVQLELDTLKNTNSDKVSIYYCILLQFRKINKNKAKDNVTMPATIKL